MARPRPKIEFIQLDERNALLFNTSNTRYILDHLKEASISPARHKEIYTEMSRHFLIDGDKIARAILLYADRMKKEARLRKGTGRQGSGGGSGPESKEDGKAIDKDGNEGLDEKLLLAELCRQTGHRYVTISLSHRTGYRECERCGKVESKYKI
jgi:hypothetical protein